MPTMRRYSLILFLAAIFYCGGCQSVTAPITRSLSNAADDYHRVTTGSESKYIANQRSQP